MPRRTWHIYFRLLLSFPSCMESYIMSITLPIQNGIDIVTPLDITSSPMAAEKISNNACIKVRLNHGKIWICLQHWKQETCIFLFINFCILHLCCIFWYNLHFNGKSMNKVETDPFETCMILLHLHHSTWITQCQTDEHQKSMSQNCFTISKHSGKNWVNVDNRYTWICFQCLMHTAIR